MLIRKSRLCFGAPGFRLGEPVAFGLTYQIQWFESRVNLAELAKLRWIEGWKYKDLALHFGRTRNAISNYCQKIRKQDFSLPGLTRREREKIKWASEN